jgi:hypothetical protein
LVVTGTEGVAVLAAYASIIVEKFLDLGLCRSKEVDID